MTTNDRYATSCRLGHVTFFNSLIMSITQAGLRIDPLDRACSLGLLGAETLLAVRFDREASRLALRSARSCARRASRPLFTVLRPASQTNLLSFLNEFL